MSWFDSLFTSAWLGLLLEPLQFTFMQQAFALVILIAIPTALLSCFLVLKGWSLMGDAISHSILPGVVIAYIMAIPYAVGAFIAGIFCALATGYIKEHTRLKEDTVMGVVFSSLFALGLVMMSKIETGVHLDHILFGDMLGLSWSNIVESAVISIAIICFITFKGKDLVVYIFDHQHAKAIGLSVKFLHYSLLVTLSLTIVASLKVVGMILVISLLIAPGAIAFLLSNKFNHMLCLAVIISVLCSITGVYLSFFIDSAPAPTIILLMSLLFILVFSYQQIKSNILMKKRENPYSNTSISSTVSADA
ncbi:metal ABC transporter permease [Colwellia psychrerythraea]|uniref:ABC-type transporter, integral membrane subunit n=1 Tax=Colwellia psychrerythraea TaxID=28229 RepID=A0A099KIP8_COLPS|nr:metal ABC transporter permease [Colwellia psychrerythraea]KGJ89872.1 ABC-type transporter, integral membrane subunit [Colwellia psychrerythraea]